MRFLPETDQKWYDNNVFAVQYVKKSYESSSDWIYYFNLFGTSVKVKCIPYSFCISSTRMWR